MELKQGWTSCGVGRQYTGSAGHQRITNGAIAIGLRCPAVGAISPYSTRSLRQVFEGGNRGRHNQNKARITYRVTSQALLDQGWLLPAAAHGFYAERPCREQNPTLMLRECPLKPFVRRWRIDPYIEKDGPVPLGQNERLVLDNRPPSSICKRRHTEIGQLGPFKLRRPLNQSFGRLVHQEPESFLSKSSVVLCCRGHRSPPT